MQEPFLTPAVSELPKRKVEWYSAFQFGLSSLALVSLWGFALVLAGVALTDWMANGVSLEGTISPLLMAAGLGASGILLLPSAGFAFWRLIGRRIPAPASWLPWLNPAWILLLLPIVLLLGHLSAQNLQVGWLFLPILHVLAVGLPVLWLLWVAQHGLPLGSHQRAWGIFGSGLVLGPFLIMAVELLALALAVVATILIVNSQPALLEELRALMAGIEPSQMDPQDLLARFTPLATRPWVIFSVIVFGAVLVPLIEEAIKPIGVWLLFGRPLTPADGFTAGLLSGAGYALFESLALASSGQDWVLLVVARMGTGVIHILNTGLMGWALTLAWQERQYFRLGLTYLTVVVIHGLWNGLTLLSSFVTLMDSQNAPTLPELVLQAGRYGPAVLGVLTFGGLLVLLASNRALRRAASSLAEKNLSPS